MTPEVMPTESRRWPETRAGLSPQPQEGSVRLDLQGTVLPLSAQAEPAWGPAGRAGPPWGPEEGSGTVRGCKEQGGAASVSRPAATAGLAGEGAPHKTTQQIAWG